MVCATLVARGPLKGQLATGTQAGYMRHRRAHEPACRSCLDAVSQRNRRWAVNNPTKVADKNRRYYYDNRERYAEWNRDWRQANPERAAAKSARWKAAHPDQVKEIADRVRRNNLAAYAEKERRRRARLRGALTIPFSADELEQRLSMFGFRCWLRTHCDGVMTREVDHVIALAAGGPHCLSNLRPACRSCNAAKGARVWSEVA